MYPMISAVVRSVCSTSSSDSASPAALSSATSAAATGMGVLDGFLLGHLLGLVAEQFNGSPKPLRKGGGVHGGGQVDVDVARQQVRDDPAELRRVFRRAATQRLFAVLVPGIAQVFKECLAELRSSARWPSRSGFAADNKPSASVSAFVGCGGLSDVAHGSARYPNASQE